MKDLTAIYPSLYGKYYDEKIQNERFEFIINKHKEIFNREEKDIALFSTSGRTEIAGNHTDHNLGRVIAASINLDTIGSVTKRDDNKVLLNSQGFPLVEVDLSSLEVIEEEKNTTNALLRGIAASFVKRGLKIGGWNAYTTTNVLKGSGLSSSAAIEVLCAEIFNNLYNDDVLDPVELAKIGQEAENIYFGKPSGLMDQVGCAVGGIVEIDFKDQKNPEIEKVSLDFEEYGYHLVIVDTKGNHANLTGEYAAISHEMKAIAAYFNASCLREVEYETFLANIPKLKTIMANDRAILRAYHYFNENIRVEKMLKALEAKDIDAFLNYVKESGASSHKYLQNIFAYNNPEEQNVAIGLIIAESVLDGKGAYRVHGGGFAGTIQAYVPLELFEEFKNQMVAVFGEGSVTKLAIRQKPTTRLV